MGIDQSLTGTGITVFDGSQYHYFLIKTEKTKNTKCPTIDDTKRLMKIWEEIDKLIHLYQVEFIALEGLSYGSKGKAIFQIGGLSHIIRAGLIENNIRFIVVPPTVVKKFWCGKGNANKILMLNEAENKKLKIPFLKKYKEFKEKKFDDNVVDSHALCCLLQDYEKYKDVVECSWEI